MNMNNNPELFINECVMMKSLLQTTNRSFDFSEFNRILGLIKSEVSSTELYKLNNQLKDIIKTMISQFRVNNDGYESDEGYESG